MYAQNVDGWVDSPFFYSKAGFVVEYLSLTIITAIAICAYLVLKKEKLVLFGMMLLGLEKAYGMLHEIIALEKTLGSIPVPVAIFLDDRCALIGIGCLALGVKQTIDHYESSQSTDELTGVYNRKALRKIPLKQFDLFFLILITSSNSMMNMAISLVTVYSNYSARGSSNIPNKKKE